jgi:hypothetical protein
MVRPRHALVLLLGVAVLAGCGSSGPKASKSKGPKLVLQPTDVPKGFQQFDAGAQTGADNSDRFRRDPSRNGREGGWKSRYRRGGTPKTVGPLVIESRADLFKSSGGAKADLTDYERVLDSEHAKRIDTSAKVGQATIAATIPGPAGVLRTVGYAVAWRDGNVSGSVTVNGFAQRVSLADALALARKQETRIARALKK